MQIKSLVALLPLLLGPVSSVVIPAAPDACGAVESHLRRNTDLQDVPKHLLSRCVQRRELEAHIELVSRDTEQWERSSNGQDHIIAARAPPVDKTKKTSKPKKTTPDTSKTNPGTSAQPKDGEAAKQPASGAGKPAKDPVEEAGKQLGDLSLQDKPGQSSQQPQKPADDKAGKQPADKSDSPSEPSEPSSPSSSEDEGSGDNYKPGQSGTESESEDEKTKKQQEAEKKKQEDKDRAPNTMYHVVTPDPKTKEGEKDKQTGEQSYYRKVGDGLPRDRYKTHNPSHSVVESGDQQPGQEKTDTQDARKRPGRIEEEATTGHKSGPGLTEWHKVTPKTQAELDAKPETKGEKPWTDDDLSKNLVKQQEQFPDHKAGDTTDDFGKTTQEMLKYCKTEQCKATRRALARRAFPGEPILRHELDAGLERRDGMIDLAE